MKLHEAIDLLSFKFPNQGEKGIKITTISGRRGHFFRVFYSGTSQNRMLILKSSSGKTKSEITEYVWNTVNERYQTLEPHYRDITTNYWNKWKNRPLGLNRNITPYVAGLINFLNLKQHQINFL